jgi:hypothetical protein
MPGAEGEGAHNETRSGSMRKQSDSEVCSDTYFLVLLTFQ